MLTVEIRQINFTDTVHALADAACRHAEQRSGRIADQLYRLAADINAIGKDIERAGLTDILNTQLPSPVSAIETATGQQRILALLKDRPGLTSDEIAEALELAESTTRQYLAQLTNAGQLQRATKKQTYTYTLATTEIVTNSPLPVAGRDGEGFLAPVPDPQSPIPNPYIPNSLAARVYDHIVENPGSTNSEIAAALGMHYVTIAKEIGPMKRHGHITQRGLRPARLYPIRPTPPTVQAAQPARAPAPTP